MNVTWDCMWWMRILPETVERTKVTMGFVFSRETTKQPAFHEDLQGYLHRWHVAVSEDNEISINQQQGAHSAVFDPGLYYSAEFGTHNFDNWVLDRVLGTTKEATA